MKLECGDCVKITDTSACKLWHDDIATLMEYSIYHIGKYILRIFFNRKVTVFLIYGIIPTGMKAV